MEYIVRFQQLHLNRSMQYLAVSNAILSMGVQYFRDRGGIRNVYLYYDCKIGAAHK